MATVHAPTASSDLRQDARTLRTHASACRQRGKSFSKTSVKGWAWIERANDIEGIAKRLDSMQDGREALRRAFVILEGLRLAVDWELAPPIKREIAEVAALTGRILGEPIDERDQDSNG